MADMLLILRNLSACLKRTPGKPLDKSEQCSDWGNRPLSGRQKRYAALDARATLLIHRELAPQVLLYPMYVVS